MIRSKQLQNPLNFAVYAMVPPSGLLFPIQEIQDLKSRIATVFVLNNNARLHRQPTSIGNSVLINQFICQI